MDLREDQEKIATLLKETMALLCKSSLRYDTSFSIEGLLGITVDKKEVFLVNIQEVYSDVVEKSVSEEAPQPQEDPPVIEIRPKKRSSETHVNHSDKRRRSSSEDKSFITGVKVKTEVCESDNETRIVKKEVEPTLSAFDNDSTLQMNLNEYQLAATAFSPQQDPLDYQLPGTSESGNPDSTVNMWTGQISLRCEVPGCTRVFYCKELFDKHMRMHANGQYRYRCDQCGQFFSSSYNLKGHVISKHAKDQAFKCVGCAKEYSYKQSFMNHILHNPQCAEACKDKLPTFDMNL